ncbi:LIM domain kinase 1 isoform X2 [Spodoptera frugiperda]|uniref:LIM domain kinase 1 n=1 Tax=Spodoptera frugiperda TaxID=7108 RepID=A0A9R0DTK9_SPOFR|nr:LIM domain kinase 1 isoform X2 [Spodoptera frugiperda]
MERPNVKESPGCAGCLNDIGDDDYVSALNQDWHKDCFRCSVCDALLSTWYFEKAGLLFCQTDYWARYGESCQQCAQVITGPVMAAGEHRFHPECFACVACGAHIEDGEPYALLERSNLYCGACYGSTVRSVSHSIRVVEVPPSSVRVAHTPPATITVKEIDSSCGVLTLHIGDRILEINGTPVRNRPLDEIERALGRPDTVIQLTIEHTADTKRTQTNTQTQTHTHSHIVEKRTQDRQTDKQTNAKEDCKQRQSIEVEKKEEGKKERLFKRKGGEDAGRWIHKRRQTPSSPLLGDKEKSSSMSKLLDAVDGDEPSGVLNDLARARSFRAEPEPGQKVFRASDLLQGELLGSGFFGEVYKVTHRDTNEVMVLKQLYRVDEDAQRNFLKEVAVLRSLKHRNVLRFVGVLYKDKRLHLVTEYVPGGTLYQLLQDSTVPLSWELRGRLARDVAAGLGYLHRRNVIHRDLNSHNCLVREDKTVIVADFGLARIVQRTANTGSPGAPPRTGTLRRKRYTVVGNPYWMAPEMMNGNVYDEKVDVFSFGIILCEIIGRVSADPDFLPRRSDFGLNEPLFIDKFCRGAHCPEPFYRIAFLACHLDPDIRPPFDILEEWLETLVSELATERPEPSELLQRVVQYASSTAALAATDTTLLSKDSCKTLSKADSGDHNVPDVGVLKSTSTAALVVPERGWRLGKCVSASHIAGAAGAAPPAGRATGAPLCRSHCSLHTAGYILHATGNTINITKVDDITKWLDPPPLKRTSPDAHLNRLQEHKARKVEPPDHYHEHLPAFLRNQSVEELESHYKLEVNPPLPFCRHISIPNSTTVPNTEDSDSSDDDDQISTWERNVKIFDQMEVDPKNVIANLVKKGENLLSKKASYDVTDVVLRNPELMTHERKIPEVDCRRYNIDYLTKNPIMAQGVKNISKAVEKDKPQEKSGFFPKKLLSPKFSRLFKPNTTEVVRTKDTEDKDKSRSKFFVQRPASPSNIGRSHRIRPSDSDKPMLNKDVLKSDIKLASMGKPMTPIFRRHLGEKPDFADGRFSYRDRRSKPSEDSKFIELGRNRIKAPLSTLEGTKLTPLIRSSHINNIAALTTVPEKKVVDKKKCDDLPKRREPGISRSNYVSLANLKINGKGKDVDDKCRQRDNEDSPVERVM